MRFMLEMTTITSPLGATFRRSSSRALRGLPPRAATAPAPAAAATPPPLPPLPSSILRERAASRPAAGVSDSWLARYSFSETATPRQMPRMKTAESAADQ